MIFVLPGDDAAQLVVQGHSATVVGAVLQELLEDGGITGNEARAEAGQIGPLAQAVEDHTSIEVSPAHCCCSLQQAEQAVAAREGEDCAAQRAERDLENAHKFALKNFAEGLLPVVDSMEMGQVAAAAQQLGLAICLENMFPRCRIGVDPDDFEAIFSAFPSLKMTLDTGHANIEDKRGRRLKGLADRFGQRIGHLHISDNRGKRDDHLAVGQGTVKFADLIRRLKIVGYDDTVTLEIFDDNRRMLVVQPLTLPGDPPEGDFVALDTTHARC